MMVTSKTIGHSRLVQDDTGHILMFVCLVWMSDTSSVGNIRLTLSTIFFFTIAVVSHPFMNIVVAQRVTTNIVDTHVARAWHTRSYYPMNTMTISRRFDLWYLLIIVANT